MFPYIHSSSELFDETEPWFAADEHPISLPEVGGPADIDVASESTPPVPADD